MDASRHFEVLARLTQVERNLTQRIEELDRRLSASIIKAAKKEIKEKRR
jgi:hypothetical protein